MSGSTRRDLLARSGAAALALAGVPGAATAKRRPPSRSKVLLLPPPAEVLARGAPPADLDLVEAASLLQARVLSSRELTAACLARIRERDAALTAFVRVYEEVATGAATAADERLSAAAVRRRRRRAPLVAGCPIALKDIYAAAGLPLTASSRILAGNVAPEDATAWARLRHFGAVLVGHAHTHEFAAGNFTPQTANPWDRERTPGGSSGGSGAALAARLVPGATGSDTLGSLRIPAALCGLTTLKPTHGLVSTRGLIPLASSFDHAGPIARSAADVSLLLSYMAGPDRRGPFLPLRPRPGARPLAGTRIGIPDQVFGGKQPAAAVAARVDELRRLLASLGAELVAFTAPRSTAEDISSLPGTRFFATVPGFEIDRFHRRWYPQRAAEYTPYVAGVLALLRAANTVPGDRAAGARVVRAFAAAWRDALERHRLDAVLQPAALVEVPRRDEAQQRTQTLGDPMVAWNYVGFPALVLPAGPSAETGLPVGAQLAALPGRDATLLQIAIDVQAHSDHHRRMPAAYAA